MADLCVGVTLFIKKPMLQSAVAEVLGKIFGGYDINKEEENISFEGRRVLLAEDNEMNMEIAYDLLTNAGFSVDKAVNGQEALVKFVSSMPNTYDLLLIDVQMPVMGGYEATKQIRKSSHPNAKSVPIFAMTANAFAEDVSASLSAGMNDHIAKPIDTQVLFATIKKYLS
jgi:CheY-like chemotaxis protein